MWQPEPLGKGRTFKPDKSVLDFGLHLFLAV